MRRDLTPSRRPSARRANGPPEHWRVNRQAARAGLGGWDTRAPACRDNGLWLEPFLTQKLNRVSLIGTDGKDLSGRDSGRSCRACRGVCLCSVQLTPAMVVTNLQARYAEAKRSADQLTVIIRERATQQAPRSATMMTMLLGSMSDTWEEMISPYSERAVDPTRWTRAIRVCALVLKQKQSLLDRFGRVTWLGGATSGAL
jgi:hypothetical protein